MIARKRLLLLAPEGSWLRRLLKELPADCEIVRQTEPKGDIFLILADAELPDLPERLPELCREKTVVVARGPVSRDLERLGCPVLSVSESGEELVRLLRLWCRLAELEARISLFEEFPWFGIYVLDRDLKIVYASPYFQSLLGRDPIDLVGRPVIEVVHPDFRENVEQILREKLRGKEFPPYIVRLLRRDGTPVWSEVFSLRVEREGVPHIVGITRDVETERRQSVLLRTLFRLVRDLLTEKQPRALLQRVVDAIVEVGGFRRAVISLYDLNWPDPLDAPVREVVTAGLSEEEVKLLLSAGGISPEQRRAYLSEEFRIGPEAYYIPYHKNPFEPENVGLPGTVELEGWSPLDLLILPLGVEGRIIGHISLDDPEDPAAPSPDTLEPITHLAAVAALAVEQAHERELRERHERHLRASQALGQQLLPAASLEEVLERAARFVEEQIGYEFVGAGRITGEEASWQVAVPSGRVARGEVLSAEDWPWLWEAIGAGEPKLHACLGDEGKGCSPMERLGVRSVVVAPVVSQGEPVAFLVAGAVAPYALTELDRRTVGNVADWCSMALETLRVRERLSGLYRISHLLSQARSREELLAQVMEILRSSFAFDYCAFFRLSGRELVLEALDAGEYIHLFPEIRPGFRISIEQGIVGLVAREGAPVLLGDVRSHSQYVPGNPEVKSELAVPVAAGDRLLGVLNVESRQPAAFGGEELAVLQAVAGQLSMALQNLEARDKLKELAVRDPLTGLHNRRFLDEVIGQEVASAKRHRRPLAFLYVDVDGFRAVNNTHGHLAGDEVLKRVARYLQENVRQADYVFRIGGDEFLILLPETDGEAEQVRKRLKAGIKDALGDVRLPIGLSIGLAIWEPGREFDLEKLIAEADKRMYDDKRRNSH